MSVVDAVRTARTQGPKPPAGPPASRKGRGLFDREILATPQWTPSRSSTPGCR